LVALAKRGDTSSTGKSGGEEEKKGQGKKDRGTRLSPSLAVESRKTSLQKLDYRKRKSRQEEVHFCASKGRESIGPTRLKRRGRVTS